MRTTGWADYALIDSGGGRKLERYGKHLVVRPEPQCLWRPVLSPDAWGGADAVFDPEGEEDAGRWRFSGAPLAPFELSWRGTRFWGRFTPFRHLAFFPEQAANWDWLDQRVRVSRKPLKVLNLFGYTGVASLVCTAAGASVTHVDASKRAVGWARENAELSGLSDRPVRWLTEDARKWVQREVRRGSLYDGIVLDPPKFGRGPGGEVWRLLDDLPELIAGCAAILSPDASFLLLNAYAERLSGLALAGLLGEALAGRGGAIDWGELALIEQGRRPRHWRLVLRPLEQRNVIRAITSLSNPTVKAVRALHMRKAREESGQFLAEGLKIVTEAVELGYAPRVLLYGAEAAPHPLLRRALAASEGAGGEAIEVSRDILAKISRRDNPQTVLGVFEQDFAALAALAPASARLLGGAGGCARSRQPRDHRAHRRRGGLRRRDPGRRLLRSLLGRGGSRDDGLDLRGEDRQGDGG